MVALGGKQFLLPGADLWSAWLETLAGCMQSSLSRGGKQELIFRGEMRELPEHQKIFFMEDVFASNME